MEFYKSFTMFLLYFYLSQVDIQPLIDLGQFYWCFDKPLAFLYEHRPATEPLRVAFLSASLIYVKQCSSASQWRKDSFLHIPPTLEVSEKPGEVANSIR